MSYRIVVHPISPRWKTHWSDGYIMWPISPILSRLDFLYPSFLCFLSFPPALLILVGSLSSCMSSLSIFCIRLMLRLPLIKTQWNIMPVPHSSLCQSLSIFFFCSAHQPPSTNLLPASLHACLPTTNTLLQDQYSTIKSKLHRQLYCVYFFVGLQLCFDMSNQTFQTLPGCFSHHTPSKWIFFPPTLMLSFFLM